MQPTTQPFHVELPFTIWDIIKTTAGYLVMFCRAMPWYIWVIVLLALAARIVQEKYDRR